MARVKLNGKYGFIDSNGQVVIEAYYDEAGYFQEGLAPVKLNGKWGFIDKTGQIAIPLSFEGAKAFDGNGRAAVRTDGKWGVINKNGQVTIDPQFDDVETVSKGLIKVRLGDKFGLMSDEGKILLPVEFTAMRFLRNMNVFLVQAGDKWGCMDVTGQWLMQPVFTNVPADGFWPQHKVVLSNGYFLNADGVKLDHYANHIKDGITFSQQRDFEGAIRSFQAALAINPHDPSAQWRLTVTEAKAEVYAQYGAGAAVLAKSKEYAEDDLYYYGVPTENGIKYGVFLRSTGQWLVAPQFDQGYGGGYYHGGFMTVKRDGKYGVIDLKGRMMSEPQFDVANSKFHEGMNEIMMAGKHGYMDTSGRLAVPAKFRFVSRFSEGLAAVALDDTKVGYIDKSGRLMIPYQFDYGDLFSEGLAAVKNNGKWGFINKAGKVVIPIQFDKVSEFSGGLAHVEKNSKWGFVDKGGKIVIPIQFEDVSSFKEGLARVKMDGKYGFIDKSGRLVIQPQYEHSGIFLEGLAIVRINGKRGAINKNGALTIQPVYDKMDSFRGGLAKVTLNGKIGFVDPKGNIVIPVQYDRVEYFINEGIIEVANGNDWGLMDKSGKWVIGPLSFRVPIQGYWPKQKILIFSGNYFNVEGHPVNHYINHLDLGYYQLGQGLYAEATKSFEAALAINPGDESALWGLTQIRMKTKS